MKQMKIYAMLFIAILAMSSCAKEDNATTAFRLKQKLVGEWIMTKRTATTNCTSTVIR